MRKMKVYALQLDIIWENKPANHAKVREMIEKAAPSPGSFVVLPEMFATGFSMNVAAIHDSDSRETQGFLSKTAADCRIYLLGGVVARDPDGRGRNECVTYSPDGREVARYSKLHPFTLGGESKYYRAGESVRIFELEKFKVAPFICYDLRFPEIFRTAVTLGANVYTVIASWPVTREEHWVTLLKSRAIENQAYVIGVNRSGKDPNYVYPGRSLIVDPHGKVLADAGREECTIAAELEIDGMLKYRKEFAVLDDLRPDFVINNI
jgi:predicted amidohydrolase